MVEWCRPGSSEGAVVVDLVTLVRMLDAGVGFGPVGADNHHQADKAHKSHKSHRAQLPPLGPS